MTGSGFKIAVCISGGGTTLRNLIEKRQSGHLNVDLALVIASNPKSAGLEFAKQEGIETVVLDHRKLSRPEEISAPLFQACRDANVALVVMGGFLRRVIIPADFENRVINIHPSLIPAYCGKGMYGMNVHRAVIKEKAMLSGCTVHFVDNEFDHGPIIAQQSVRVGESTAEELQKAVFEVECELYPRVIEAIARGKVSVVGDEVLCDMK